MSSRMLIRLVGLALGISGMLVYSMWKANPALALGIGGGLVSLSIGTWLFKRHEEARVKKMVADIDQTDQPR